MRFIPSSMEAMRKGHKSQTRRVQKDGERLVYSHPFGPDLGYKDRLEGPVAVQPEGEWLEGWTIPTILDKHGHIKLQVGRRYAIQPAGKRYGAKAIGSYLCTSLRGEPLQDISEKDAITEGVQPIWNATNVPYSTGFAYFWDGIHKKGKQWEDNPQVWVIGEGEFEWKEK